MNLNDALNEIQKCEDMEIEVPDDISTFLKDKIDGYYMAMNRIEADSLRYKAIADHYYKKATARYNEYERIKNYIAAAMTHFGWTKLKGDKHSVKLITQNRFCYLTQPNQEIAAKYPDFVEVKVKPSYSWKQDELKASYEENPESVKDFADYKEIKFIKFD